MHPTAKGVFVGEQTIWLDLESFNEETPGAVSDFPVGYSQTLSSQGMTAGGKWDTPTLIACVAAYTCAESPPIVRPYKTDTMSQVWKLLTKTLGTLLQPGQHS